MAIIQSIKRIYNSNQIVREQSFVNADFIKLDANTIQINTYGSDDRENKDTQSQNIRITKEVAKDFINLLQNAFDIK